MTKQDCIDAIRCYAWRMTSRLGPIGIVSGYVLLAASAGLAADLPPKQIQQFHDGSIFGPFCLSFDGGLTCKTDLPALRSILLSSEKQQTLMVNLLFSAYSTSLCLCDGIERRMTRAPTGAF
ncbi:hypothetical protein [Microvirga terricola]|uniref:Rap1a immunity protein domain-containing protein n=1 Tax=Microvirga terricola TaxID=2719797 RepID=A0ABX0VAP9_9HYPH|nr:hypothetical protein [Microvirga terricola]NIX76578.1 hypothetical protein [Microvirga terricola]